MKEMHCSDFYLQVEVGVEFKQEDDKVVAYVPGLDIAIYGNTLKKAKERFKRLIEMYFEELLEMRALDKVLLERGWSKIEDEAGQVQWSAPKILERDTENIKIMVCPKVV